MAHGRQQALLTGEGLGEVSSDLSSCTVQSRDATAFSLEDVQS